MANSVDPEQTDPIGAVCSGYTLFASILNSSVMLGNYLQQTTSADDIFLGALRVNPIVLSNVRLHEVLAFLIVIRIQLNIIFMTLADMKLLIFGGY